MGWLIALAVFAGVAVLPVGLRVVYDSDGFFLYLFFGLIRLRLYPKHERTKKDKKKSSEAPKTQTKQKGKTPKTEKKSGKWKDFLPLVSVAIEFLGDLRRKIRISRLEMNLIMASDDPCDLALNYGKTWAAVGNLMPLLERVFVIKKRNIQIQCDFTETQTRVNARADISITVGRVLFLAVFYGFKLLRKYLKIRNLRKDGTEL